jgi:UDP-N-acetylmuramoylalanine--D-glutamate ligase
MISELKGRRVLVTGALGKTGRAMADLLTALGAVVYGTDRRTDAPLEGMVDLRPREDASLLAEYSIEVVFVSPGVPLDGELFQKARLLGIPIIGDLDFGYLYLKENGIRARIIGITGTDGKSTTTALTAHLLREAGIQALECGNYGLPFSKAVLQPASVFVCECSSFQLEDLHYFRPDAGLLLNIAPDHLDRYPGMADYLRAKLKLFSLQEKEDSAIIGPGIMKACRDYGIEADEFPGRLRSSLIEVTPHPEAAILGDASLPWSEFALNSETKRQNAAMALAAVDALLKRDGDRSVHHQKILQGLRSFRGLPHRQEIVVEREGIIFVNDSKATTVHAVLSALNSLADKKIYLLLGGLDKNLDFSVFREDDRLHIYPFGQAAEKIALQTGVQRRFSDLEEAFYAALRDARRLTAYFGGSAQADSVILLSPACASQDAYRNYEERGEHFRRLALQ